jgi:hypothetical protein
LQEVEDDEVGLDALVLATFGLIIPQGEENVIQAFVEFVAKLNEVAFRPLFRKLFDWAFGTGKITSVTEEHLNSNPFR